MNSIQFLDAVRKRHHLNSDNKLASFLDCPQGAISRVRTGSRKLDPTMALAIASALDEPAEYVLAEIQVERAKRPDVKRAWRRLAKVAKSAAASVATVLAMASSTNTAATLFDTALQCILC